jgi:hypothetical protein
MARLSTRQQARENALKIFRDRIQQIGMSTPGWGVEILLAAYTHLIDGAPVEIINPFSTVDAWDRGIIWTPGCTTESVSRWKQ